MINGNFATSGLSLPLEGGGTHWSWRVIHCSSRGTGTCRGRRAGCACRGTNGHGNNELQLHGPGNDEINLILAIYLACSLSADFYPPPRLPELS